MNEHLCTLYPTERNHCFQRPDFDENLILGFGDLNYSRSTSDRTHFCGGEFFDESDRSRMSVSVEFVWAGESGSGKVVGMEAGLEVELVPGQGAISPKLGNPRGGVSCGRWWCSSVVLASYGQLSCVLNPVEWFLTVFSSFFPWIFVCSPDF